MLLRCSDIEACQGLARPPPLDKKVVVFAFMVMPNLDALRCQSGMQLRTLNQVDGSPKGIRWCRCATLNRVDFIVAVRKCRITPWGGVAKQKRKVKEIFWPSLSQKSFSNQHIRLRKKKRGGPTSRRLVGTSWQNI